MAVVKISDFITIFEQIAAAYAISVGNSVVFTKGLDWAYNQDDNEVPTNPDAALRLHAVWPTWAATETFADTSNRVYTWQLYFVEYQNISENEDQTEQALDNTLDFVNYFIAALKSETYQEFFRQFSDTGVVQVKSQDNSKTGWLVTLSVNSDIQDCDLEPFDPCGSVRVFNSDGTYNVQVDCPGVLELPDIQFTDSNGVQSSVPAQTDITATQAPSETALACQPEVTGQTSSVGNDDDGENQAGRNSPIGFFKVPETFTDYPLPGGGFSRVEYGHDWRFVSQDGNYFDADDLNFKFNDGTIIGPSNGDPSGSNGNTAFGVTGFDSYAGANRTYRYIIDRKTGLAWISYTQISADFPSWNTLQNRLASPLVFAGMTFRWANRAEVFGLIHHENPLSVSSQCFIYPPFDYANIMVMTSTSVLFAGQEATLYFGLSANNGTSPQLGKAANNSDLPLFCHNYIP